MAAPAPSRFSPYGAFLFLLLLSLSIPHLLQAIFPGGRATQTSASKAPEEKIASSSHSESAGTQRIRTEENLAWINGQNNGGALSAAELSEDETSLADTEDFGDSRKLDLSPGLILEYSGSRDSLDTERTSYGVGGFFFISTTTHFQALARDLNFEDDFDDIDANSGTLEIAHAFPNDLVLVGGVTGIKYADLHSSWNGYVEAGKRVTSKIYLDFMASYQDVWERLINIRDKLRLYELATSVTYEFRQYWSAHVVGDFSWYSDDNERTLGLAEVTRELPILRGLSLGLGVQATTFLEQNPNYWSPTYYHYIFARLRWTNRPVPWPFPFSIAEDDNGPRLTGLLEYMPGVNDEGHFEQTVRGGLRYQLTRKVAVDAEASYFGSEDRFGDEYNEKRVDGKLVVQFP